MGVHQQLDNFPCSHLIQLERELQCEYNKILAQEELLWYQKSRENLVTKIPNFFIPLLFIGGGTR